MITAYISWKSNSIEMLISFSSKTWNLPAVPKLIVTLAKALIRMTPWVELASTETLEDGGWAPDWKPLADARREPESVALVGSPWHWNWNCIGLDPSHCYAIFAIVCAPCENPPAGSPVLCLYDDVVCLLLLGTVAWRWIELYVCLTQIPLLTHVLSRFRQPYQLVSETTCLALLRFGVKSFPMIPGIMCAAIGSQINPLQRDRARVLLNHSQ